MTTESATTEQRHQTMALQELSEIDETLAKYLGPNHLIRKDLARLLGELREKLRSDKTHKAMGIR